MVATRPAFGEAHSPFFGPTCSAVDPSSRPQCSQARPQCLIGLLFPANSPGR